MPRARTDTARARLESAAFPLRPHRPPYYLHTPTGPSEPAPGWYIILAADGQPAYLGANVFGAYDTIAKLIEIRSAA